MSTPAGKALAADPSPLRNAFFQRNP
jgi:hypothetical protein